MAKILNIETSTDYCSVAISENGKCIFFKINEPDETKKIAHSEFLAVYIKEVLEKSKISIDNIDAVALSGGPGSYTGLRIGTSTCKGLCFGANIPLIALNTLQIIANMAKDKTNTDFDFIVPMIDAKRMEVYTCLFDNSLKQISKIEAKIIDENSFAEYVDKKILFCGNGAEKCSEILKSKNFTFAKGIFPSAEYMGILSEDYYTKNEFADLAYYDPFYLKEFVATTSKKSLF